tara:strand:- start:174 stop:563 length:390 start_codon:yes stop_codon:yes gene_type:complete
MPVCLPRKKLPFAVWFVQHKAKNAPRKFLPQVVLKIKKFDPAKKFLLRPFHPSKSCAELQKRRAVPAFAEGEFFVGSGHGAGWVRHRAPVSQGKRARSVVWQPRALASPTGLCFELNELGSHGFGKLPG